MNHRRTIANRYEITGTIGQGGMGHVYRGVDRDTGQPVAIKLLNPDIVEAELDVIERFEREGEALRQLNHPNIVQMLDSVEEDEMHYLVMEYVAGGSVRALIDREGALPLRRAIEIALDVADALTRAHHLNIIHRDIKPDNVLLAEDGTPRLSDFGVARLGNRTRLTETGSMIGTFAYLSPEGCRSEDLDARTDVWSFGVMLFEMLTGRRPFEQTQAAAMVYAIINNPIPGLKEHRPEIPTELVNLITWMLEKDPAARIPSMRQVGAELEAILYGLDTPGSRRRKAGVKSPTSQFATPKPSRGDDEILVRFISQPTAPSSPVIVPTRLRRRWVLGGIITLVLVVSAVLVTVLGSGDNKDKSDPSATLVQFVAADEYMGPVAKPYRIIGYYTSWSVYARGYIVTAIPADKLTHINYAFANISKEGECIVGDEWADLQYPYADDPTDAPFLGNFHQLNVLKEKHPHLKTLISVGGWMLSDHFSDAALTAESRAKFVRSCVALMKQYGFDGLDIDWEYPGSVGANLELVGRPEDTENFTLLLAELRAQLDTQGEQDGSVHYLLTIAGPADPYHYRNIQLDQIHPYLDWINVMAFDFHGGWETTTNFNAPLYAASDDPNPDNTAFNVDATMKAYLAAGIPAEKLIMGVPFYGRGWSGVPDIQSGLFQPAAGVPDGTWEPGVFDYSDLEDNYLLTSSRYWHNEASVPWLYNADKQIMISYDDLESLRIKAAYTKRESLGGIMLWELGGDTRSHTLLNALYEQINQG